MSAPHGIPQCSRGWSGRCARSKGARCTCACGGQNHGNPAARKDNALGETLPQTPARILDYAGDEPRRHPTPEAIAVADERVVWCVRTVEPGLFGDVDTARVYLTDHTGREQLARRYVRHSPTGFEWGYGGSGPAGLALNILALVVPVKEASRLHQDFKFAHIATLPREGGALPLTAVRLWLAERYQHEAADDAALAPLRDDRGWPYTPEGTP